MRRPGWCDRRPVIGYARRRSATPVRPSRTGSPATTARQPAAFSRSMDAWSEPVPPARIAQPIRPRPMAAANRHNPRRPPAEHGDQELAGPLGIGGCQRRRQAPGRTLLRIRSGAPESARSTAGQAQPVRIDQVRGERSRVSCRVIEAAAETTHSSRTIRAAPGVATVAAVVQDHAGARIPGALLAAHHQFAEVRGRAPMDPPDVVAGLVLTDQHVVRLRSARCAAPPGR